MSHRSRLAYTVLIVATLGCVFPLGETDTPPPPPPPVTVAAEPAPPPVPPVAPVPAVPEPPRAQPWVAELGEARSIRFDGEEYLLAHRASGEQGALNEYIRAHETLERWTKLIAVRHHPHAQDPRTAALEVAGRVRAENRPHRVLVGPEGQHTVEFTTWNDDIVELNVFVYRIDPSRPGVLSHQAAVRAYRPDTTGLIERLDAERARLFDLARTFEFPAIVE